MTKIGVICPTRDRPQFLGQFKKYLSSQTIQPCEIEIVDYDSKSDVCDITERYRYGYDKLRGRGLDVIAFMEDDEWYSPEYLEVMVGGWLRAGKPKMFGLDYTIYYHLYIGKSFTFRHDKRSSAMSTLIRPDMEFDWCADDYAYTDSWLWKIVGGVVWNPRKDIVVGVKHGIGKTGGRWHRDNLDRYKSREIDFRKLVGEDAYAFYRSIYPSTVRLARDSKKGLYLDGL